MCKRGIGTANRCFGIFLLLGSFLWVLSGCRSNAPAFPPTAETVQAAAEKLGWTLDLEETQRNGETQVLYALETEEQATVGVHCALVDGKPVFTETCILTFFPDKPQFSWEDWEKALTLAETLYGGFDEGELYKAFSQQEMPEVLPAGTDASVGKESLCWEVELPAGYAQVRWSISAGQVEHSFPEPTILDWRATFMVSLRESREAGSLDQHT